MNSVQAFHEAITYRPCHHKSSISGPQREVISKFVSRDQRASHVFLFSRDAASTRRSYNLPSVPSASLFSRTQYIGARMASKRHEFIYADDPTGYEHVAFYVTAHKRHESTLSIFNEKNKKNLPCNYEVTTRVNQI